MRKMNKNIFKHFRLFSLICFLSFSLAFNKIALASDLKDFLITCGWGTLAGAGVGAMSLAFVENPGSKTNNIAVGASLGLYTGIGLGLYYLNQNSLEKSKPQNDFSWLLMPQFQKQKWDGLYFSARVKSF